MSIFTDWYNKNVQGAGALIGGIGGLYQGLTGATTPLTTSMRNIGGQLTGGARSFNLVPEARAMEQYPTVLGTGTGTIDQSGMYPSVSQDGGGITGGTPTGGGTPAPTGSEPSQPSGPSPEEIYRQQQIENISNKWSGYFSGLDQLMGGLPGQADILKSTADIQSGQQQADLLASTEEQKAALGKQTQQTQVGQVKTLKDISNNIRNLMQAGNVYLGARGAGDSSAINQYAYALTKLGSQQRGDVVTQVNQTLNDINDRLTKVGNIFTQEKNRIGSELSVQINNIATWLADQQQAIKQAKLQGELDKSTDIQALTDNLYNIAVQEATKLQNAYQEQTSALQTWALNNSTSLKEAQSKLSGYGSFQAPALSYKSISGTPQFDQSGNMAVQYGGGFQQLTDEEKRRLGML